MRWDLFCAVVDNYGDIGVCWRLARQLVQEHDIQVRLWVDDLPSLHRLCPTIDPLEPIQQLDGVEVRAWTDPFLPVEPGKVVIEAFGCDLPEPFVAAMAKQEPRPTWINLEYLSAEAWVTGCHRLASPHPKLPLTKHFFFPGFTPDTGGLIRERTLLPARDSLKADPATFWQKCGLPTTAADELRVSLFCYDGAPIPDLLNAMAAGPVPTTLLVPDGKPLAGVAAYLGFTPTAEHPVRRKNLTVHALPFLPQIHYDELLWACDVNLVRGEDSFVRAQWAARPMLWHIYPQADDAHLVKLEAFLDRYLAEAPAPLARTTRDLWRSWNTGGEAGKAWLAWLRQRPVLDQHAQAWCSNLAAQPDLAAQLVQFTASGL